MMSELVQIIILLGFIFLIVFGIFIFPNIVVNRVKDLFDTLSRIPIDKDEEEDK